MVSTELIEFVGNRPIPSTALWGVPVPFDTALLGATFFQQALVTDPGVNPRGAIMSNAGRGTIGNL